MADDFEVAELPQRMFAIGCEPSGRHRINTYFTLRYIEDIKNALDAAELQVLRESQFGLLLEMGNHTFSVMFVHYILQRQLVTTKNHELWWLFAGKPIRFGIKEFAAVTGTNCSKGGGGQVVRQRKLNKKGKEKASSSSGEVKVFMQLFGKGSKPTTSWIHDKLRMGKKYKDPITRLRLALLMLVYGILCPSGPTTTIKEEYYELLEDIDSFLSYPWGRKSFMMTIKSIKGCKPAKFTQDSVAIQGFTHAILLVTIASYPQIINSPMLLECVQEEGVTTDAVVRCMAGLNLMVNVEHARCLDSQGLVTVKACFGDYIGGPGDELLFADEEPNPRVEYMLTLIRDDYPFDHNSWQGGLDAAAILDSRLGKDTGKAVSADVSDESEGGDTSSSSGVQFVRKPGKKVKGAGRGHDTSKPAEQYGVTDIKSVINECLKEFSVGFFEQIKALIDSTAASDREYTTGKICELRDDVKSMLLRSDKLFPKMPGFTEDGDGQDSDMFGNDVAGNVGTSARNSPVADDMLNSDFDQVRRDDCTGGNTSSDGIDPASNIGGVSHGGLVREEGVGDGNGVETVNVGAATVDLRRVDDGVTAPGVATNVKSGHNPMVSDVLASVIADISKTVDEQCGEDTNLGGSNLVASPQNTDRSTSSVNIDAPSFSLGLSQEESVVKNVEASGRVDSVSRPQNEGAQGSQSVSVGGVGDIQSEEVPAGNEPKGKGPATEEVGERRTSRRAKVVTKKYTPELIRPKRPADADDKAVGDRQPKKLRRPIHNLVGKFNPFVPPTPEISAPFIEATENTLLFELPGGLCIKPSVFQRVMQGQAQLLSNEIDMLVSFIQKHRDSLKKCRFDFYPSCFLEALIRQSPSFSESQRKEDFYFTSPSWIVFTQRPQLIEAVDMTYCPFMVDGKHWVGLIIDLIQWNVAVVDCDPQKIHASERAEYIKPIQVLLPYLLRKHGSNKVARELSLKPFTSTQLLLGIDVKNEGLEGIGTLVMLELHALGFMKDVLNIDTDMLHSTAENYAIGAFRSLKPVAKVTKSG